MSLIGLRVLVVEDEPIVAMLVEEYLEDLGCKVVAVATRLNDALKQARTLDLDAGVLDVNLAGELSYPVAEVLRDRTVPFLFATGYGSAGKPTSMFDAPVLSKPFRMKQLAEILLKVCGDRASRCPGAD
jgi:CheY-like chemotaxis protein